MSTKVIIQILCVWSRKIRSLNKRLCETSFSRYLATAAPDQSEVNLLRAGSIGRMHQETSTEMKQNMNVALWLWRSTLKYQITLIKLCLEAHKTEIILFTTCHPYDLLCFCVIDVEIELYATLKYLTKGSRVAALSIYFNWEPNRT